MSKALKAAASPPIMAGEDAGHVIPWSPTPPRKQTDRREAFEQESTSGTSRMQIIEHALFKAAAPMTRLERIQAALQEEEKKRRKLPTTHGDTPSVPAKRRRNGEELCASLHGVNTSDTPKYARVFLGKEQLEVLNAVEAGKRVFYTGAAGTGKSVLLGYIIEALRKKYTLDSEAVAVTATTGIAACNIGGVTLNSWGGIGPGTEDVDKLIRKIRGNGATKRRWLRTQVLLIDEVSMMEGALFDKLAEIARRLRTGKDQAGKPFGGIQLILTGDFYQLPPVGGIKGAKPLFAFEARAWEMCIKKIWVLTRVYRQRDAGEGSSHSQCIPLTLNKETGLIDLLNEIRQGRVSKEAEAHLERLRIPVVYSDGIDPTELFARRAEVGKANAKRLGRIPGDSHFYSSRDNGKMDSEAQDKALENTMAPKELELKRGAQVMLIKNYDSGLANGCLGIVTEFEHTSSWAGEKLGTPMRKEGVYPVVQFSTRGEAGDRVTRTALVLTEKWEVLKASGGVLASRRQVSLILAWAISIHKSQGQTLDRVKVDLAQVFEEGQAYVALSRATTENGLHITKFDVSKIRVNKKVVAWEAGLPRA